MAHMLRKHQNDHTNKIRSNVGIHGESRMISKIQPKIRIIHIFAPEIIKTDVANFRELVQSLTGKPTPSSAATTTTTTTATTSTSSRSSLEKNSSENSDAFIDWKLPREMEAFDNKPMVPAAGGYDQSYDYHYKPVVSYADHHNNNQGGGFLQEFEGVNDYFMQEIGELSFAPMDLQNNRQQQHHHQHQFEDNLHSISY